MTSHFIICISNLVNQKYEGGVETGIVCKVGGRFGKLHLLDGVAG